MTSRRDFLLAMGTSALAPAALSAMTDRLASAPLPLRGVGVQLYMLRTQMRADPERTLARVAELGFTEIEWWGQWGRTPAQLRAALDANGLRAPSAHYGLGALQPDQLPRTLEAAAVIGHTTLVVASTESSENGTLAAWQRTIATISEAGRVGRSAGIRTGYHNHDFEFQPFEGSNRLERFLAESDPAVVDLELDCFWAFKAGHDPIAFLRRYRDRVTMLHVKDSTAGPAFEQRDVGAGVIDWKTLMATATAGRVAHAYVEHDAPADAWATAAAGRAHLRTLGY